LSYRNYSECHKLSAFALWVMAIFNPEKEAATPAMLAIVNAVRSDGIQPSALFDLLSLRDDLAARSRDIQNTQCEDDCLHRGCWDELQEGANALWDTFAFYMEQYHGCKSSSHLDFDGYACVPGEFLEDKWSDPKRCQVKQLQAQVKRLCAEQDTADAINRAIAAAASSSSSK